MDRENRGQEIAQWQRDLKEQPQVWGVFVWYQGEEDLADIYESAEAAAIEVAWRNKRKPRHGNASARPLYVHSLDLAKRRFQS